MKAVSRRSFLAGTAGALAMPAIGRGQNAANTVRFAVDWVWQGNHSIWTYAAGHRLVRWRKDRAAAYRVVMAPPTT